MVHVLGLHEPIQKSSATTTGVPTAPMVPLSSYGIPKTEDLIQNMGDSAIESTSRNLSIVNADRPTNWQFRVNNRSMWWRYYDVMDRYAREVSILSTIISRSTTELFRYDLELKPRFAYKCVQCGYESQYVMRECPVCGSTHLRKPDHTQKRYLLKSNGKTWIDEANRSGQSLKDVLKSYADAQYLYNQAYLLCVSGDVVDEQMKRVVGVPLEFISLDPKNVRFLYDESGTPGTRYAFTRDKRDVILDITVDEDRERIETLSDEGKVLYPAYWQVGESPGACGVFQLFTEEEIYQDHWFKPSMIYGYPVWLDIEDDILAYHFIEKHNLKKYEYGYVRKVLILPGFNKEDARRIAMGVRDVLAKNDNSIPIISLPPQAPNTAEMKAQTLELGTESSSDLMQIKDDIRERLCAHIGVPNLFAGDVEASGGMNNESQQITIMDRYLLDKYSYIDRLCAWFMSWFPKITDWELVLARPSKAYTDARRRLDQMQEAAQMQQLGFITERIGGEFWYSEQPIGQMAQEIQDGMQVDQLRRQKAGMGAADPNMGLMPGDGEGPPEKGTARREDPDIDEAKNDVELTKREANEAAEV